MKKHLLGLAIFSFIFASFAIAFANLYAPMQICPITQIEEITQPVFETDRRNKCNKKSENNKFEVISTQYNLDEKKLITQIRMKLNSYDSMPKRVSVGTNLYTENQNEVKKIEVKDISSNDFEFRRDTNEAIFYVVSDLSKSGEINRKENLYAIFDFYLNYSDDLNLRINNIRTEAKSVLFVHGKNSIIKK